MTIKSDKWIRRMAETTGMIEPFEPRQIRERDGHKIMPVVSAMRRIHLSLLIVMIVPGAGAVWFWRGL